MRTRFTTLPLLLAALLPLACTVEVETNAAPEPAGAGDTPALTDVTAQVHRVECGCALEEVGHCGNYIEVDGKFVEVAGDLGLGSMEWCGQSGLSAHAEGEVKDGKFVATALSIVP